MGKNSIYSKKLFIFDLDGTIADSYSAIERSLNFTLRKFGYKKVSYQKVKRNVGRGDERFILAFFQQKDAYSALPIYRAHHKRSLMLYSKLRPDAKKLLSVLRRRKRILAVASNRPAYFTNILLKKLGIKKYFLYVLCADQIKSLKPNPKILNILIKRAGVDKKDAVFIGDMDIDLETAQRAKIDSVFIKGGSSSLADVRKYKNKKIISRLDQILTLYN